MHSIVDFVCMNLKIRMWKASWVIVVLFFLGLAGDLWSTFRIGELVKYLEANVLYHYTGWVGFFLMNLILLYMMLYMYDKKKPTVRFGACVGIVYLSAMRIWAVYNNLRVSKMVATGEITEAMAQSIPLEVKVWYYFTHIFLLVLLPVLLTLLSYSLFSMDHKAVRDE